MLCAIGNEFKHEKTGLDLQVLTTATYHWLSGPELKCLDCPCDVDEHLLTSSFQILTTHKQLANIASQ